MEVGGDLPRRRRGQTLCGPHWKLPAPVHWLVPPRLGRVWEGEAPGKGAFGPPRWLRGCWGRTSVFCLPVQVPLSEHPRRFRAALGRLQEREGAKLTESRRQLRARGPLSTTAMALPLIGHSEAAESALPF